MSEGCYHSIHYILCHISVQIASGVINFLTILDKKLSSNMTLNHVISLFTMMYYKFSCPIVWKYVIFWFKIVNIHSKVYNCLLVDRFSPIFTFHLCPWFTIWGIDTLQKIILRSYLGAGPEKNIDVPRNSDFHELCLFCFSAKSISLNIFCWRRVFGGTVPLNKT